MGTLNNINLMRTLGVASTIGLLSLVCFIISPPVTEGASAEEATVSSATLMSAKVEPVLSVALDNSVEVEFSPNKEGDFENNFAQLTVATNNIDGYRILMNTGDNKSSLTNIATGSTINSISGTGITSTNFPMNSWGYSLVNDDAVVSSYNAIPASAQEIKKVATGDVVAGRSDSYKLNFGVKVDHTIPAGSYNQQIVVSVVANPVELRTLMDLTTMQEMTSKICTNTPIPEDKMNPITKQLTDSRDGKKYWVSKLADGNCWMVQNLAYDIPADGVPENASDNPASGWQPTEATITENDFEREISQSTSYSWDLGEYVLLDPTNGIPCSYIENGGSLLSCNRVVKFDGSQDSHYLFGNYYQWHAATAGTGNIESGNVTGSVCPKGWTLPKTDTALSYDNLLETYNIKANEVNSVAMMTSEPFYLGRMGVVDLALSSLKDLGTSGGYWYGTMSDGSQFKALDLLYYMSDKIFPIHGENNNLYRTRMVRCVAR